MMIDLQENSDLLHGCSELTKTDDGWYPSRFKASNAWGGREGFMPPCTAGVRLCFKTDAQTLRLNLILGECSFEFGRGDVDVFAGDERIVTAKPEGPWTTGQSFTIEVPLPEGQPVVTVYLPTYRSAVIKSMELVGGGFVRPFSEFSGRILFIGDSITQGYGATPGFCYAARLARSLNVDYLNLGLGGACMPKKLPETLDLKPFTHVVLAFGTNDANNLRNAATITASLTQLLKQVCDGKRQVLVSSPVAWPEGKRRGKRMSWDEVESAIRQVATSYPGIRYVDGSQVLPWHDAYFVDGIHPNHEGMTALAQAFLDMCQ